jgi:DNA-binding NarL/FixJ family response regulator
MTDHLLTRNGDAPPRAVTVGIVNDYEIVVRGVAAMLAPYDDRVHVIELATDNDELGSSDITADVALFDSFAGRRHTLSRAAEMVAAGRACHVVLYTWDAAPEFVRAAQHIGVSGVVLKTRSADALVDAIERVAAGEKVGFDAALSPKPSTRAVELSDREAEVLALIARGLTNAQIADELYLSIETIKTYVKRLYAKLDVHNRAQAAVAAATYQLTPRLEH